MRYISFIAACILVTACEKQPTTNLNEIKTAYIEQNLPQIKNVREQVIFQIKTCTENVHKLEKLKGSFEKEESKLLVQAKIDQIVKQKKELLNYINKIDVEVEKGLALQTFNSIDGGGIRHEEIERLAQEAQKSAINAQRVNADVAVEYSAPIIEAQPPKAIPVENSAPLATSNNEQIQQPVPKTQTANIIKPSRPSLIYQLPSLYEARNMYAQQLNSAHWHRDIVKIRIYEEQIRIIDNKISYIKSEAY